MPAISRCLRSASDDTTGNENPITTTLEGLQQGCEPSGFDDHRALITCGIATLIRRLIAETPAGVFRVSPPRLILKHLYPAAHMTSPNTTATSVVAISKVRRRYRANQRMGTKEQATGISERNQYGTYTCQS